MVRQIRKPRISARDRDREQRGARRLRLHVEAEDVLEVGQPVVAAEAEIVAEEAEHQRERQRLRDDREIDAGDARAEREPAEHEGEHARHQQHHQRRIGEVVEAVPVDRQLGPVQEHHEVRPDRIGIDAARADLAHQVHAHRVAAEREERAVAEREDAAIAPDQVDREREQRVADILAPQRHQIGRHMPRRARRQQQIEQRHRDADRREHQDEPDRAAVERADERRAGHAPLMPPPPGP